MPLVVKNFPVLSLSGDVSTEDFRGGEGVRHILSWMGGRRVGGAFYTEKNTFEDKVMIL